MAKLATDWIAEARVRPATPEILALRAVNIADANNQQMKDVEEAESRRALASIEMPAPSR